MDSSGKVKSHHASIGLISIIGAFCMLTGAAFWGASGTDLWQALANNTIEIYLSQLPDAKQILIINTTFWILGVLLMATAVTLMADFCRTNKALAQMAKVFAVVGSSVAIVSFIIMLSLAIIIPSVDVALIIGWIGARLDDMATILIIGFSPLCISLAGKTDWVPGWLRGWGYLAGFTGLLGIISLLTGIVIFGFIIIPIGIGWMIASGIVLMKITSDV